MSWHLADNTDLYSSDAADSKYSLVVFDWLKTTPQFWFYAHAIDRLCLLENVKSIANIFIYNS